MLFMNFQSCIVYQKRPSTLEEAANPKNKKTKITTLDGEKYEFDWFDIEDEYISSTLKTKREIFSIDEIQYILSKGGSKNIKLDSTTQLRGDYTIKTTNSEFRCFEIERKGDAVTAIRTTGKDTLTIHIPQAQIEKIQIVNRGDSAVGNIGIFILAICGVFVGLYIVAVTGPS